MLKMPCLDYIIIILIIISMLTLFNENAQLDTVQSSLGSSLKIYKYLQCDKTIACKNTIYIIHISQLLSHL